MVEIAKGYNLMAMDLGNYIAKYVPGNWIVDIQNVHPIPLFLPKEVKELYEFHKAGTLVDKLKDEDGQLKYWFIQEAITSFFEKKEYARCEADLD